MWVSGRSDWPFTFEQVGCKKAWGYLWKCLVPQESVCSPGQRCFSRFCICIFLFGIVSQGKWTTEEASVMPRSALLNYSCIFSVKCSFCFYACRRRLSVKVSWRLFCLLRASPLICCGFLSLPWLIASSLC